MLSLNIRNILSGLTIGISKFQIVTLYIIALPLVLSACGGGSSSGNEDTNDRAVITPITINGVAASDNPIVGATVIALCTDESGFLNAVVTGEDGSFTGEVNIDALPCALRVTEASTETTLYSIAFESGITNITLLTNLIIAYYSDMDPVDWYYGDISDSDLVTLNAAMTEVLSYLLEIGYGFLNSDFNVFNQPFYDEDGALNALHQLQIAIQREELLTDYMALLSWILESGLSGLPSFTGISSEPLTIENKEGVWQSCEYVSGDHEMLELTYHSDGSWTMRRYKLSSTNCARSEEDILVEEFDATETVGDLVLLENGDRAYEVLWETVEDGELLPCYTLLAIENDLMFWGDWDDEHECDSPETRPVSLMTDFLLERRSRG